MTTDSDTEVYKMAVESSYHAFAFRCCFKRFPVLSNKKTRVYFANRQFFLSKLCKDIALI